MLKTDFMYNYLDHKKIIQIQSKRQIMKLELSCKIKDRIGLDDYLVKIDTLKHFPANCSWSEQTMCASPSSSLPSLPSPKVLKLYTNDMWARKYTKETELKMEDGEWVPSTAFKTSFINKKHIDKKHVLQLGGCSPLDNPCEFDGSSI